MSEDRQAVTLYRVFDHVLLVLSESPEIGEHIDCFLGNLRFHDGESAEPTIRLAIFRAPSDCVILCSPELGMADTRLAALPSWLRFRSLFMRISLNGLQPHYTLHASSLGDQRGKALVIAGAANAGKTSVLIDLLQRGFHMVCDDYAVFHLETTKLLALPVGVTVTESTITRFPVLETLKRDACSFFCEHQWQWTMNLAEIYPAATPFESFEPTHLFFMTPDFGGRSSLQELSREEALWCFQSGRFTSPPHIMPLGDCSIAYQRKCYDLARRLIGTARFFRVVNGDIHATADLIAESFGRQS